MFYDWKHNIKPLELGGGVTTEKEEEDRLSAVIIEFIATVFLVQSLASTG